MNISRFHISCIQKTDNRPYLTVGGALDHIEHFKRTEQYVNSICFSRIGVCGLPMNEGRQRACAKSRPQRCGKKYSQTVLNFPNSLVDIPVDNFLFQRGLKSAFLSIDCNASKTEYLYTS
jgi:hypothetical protein